MADSAEPENVFLDTEVFDAHQLDFTSPNLRRLVRLAAAGNLRLLMTTVTKSEILAHLDKHAKEVFRQIQNYRRASRLVKKILPPEAVAALASADEAAIRAGLQEEFDGFIAESKLELLEVEKVSPEAVLKKYFERKAPFGDGAKKAEFPDAFASAALQAWCAENEAKVYIVSNDTDWKRACREDANLISVSRIDELLQLFADSVLVTAMLEAMGRMREELIERITKKAEDLDYYPGDQIIDGEVDEVEDVDVEIEGFHIVEAKDGVAAVSVDCTISVNVFVSAQDADSWVYDSEVKDVHYRWTASGRVSRTLERGVEVTLAYDVAHPERVAITDVEFENETVDLHVEEDELSRDDDQDYEDMVPDDIEPDCEPSDEEPPEYDPGDLEPPDEPTEP